MENIRKATKEPFSKPLKNKSPWPKFSRPQTLFFCFRLWSKTQTPLEIQYKSAPKQQNTHPLSKKHTQAQKAPKTMKIVYSDDIVYNKPRWVLVIR